MKLISLLGKGWPLLGSPEYSFPRSLSNVVRLRLLGNTRRSQLEVVRLSHPVLGNFSNLDQSDDNDSNKM